MLVNSVTTVVYIGVVLFLDTAQAIRDCQWYPPIEINTEESITLPRYNNGRYRGNLHCAWRVRAPPGKVVSVEFVYVDTACPHAVTVRNGGNETAPVLEHRCGVYNPYTNPMPVLSTSNTMFITFVSDNQTIPPSFRGIELKLRFEDYVPIANTDACYISSQPGRITTEKALITSQQYGRGIWKVGARCLWTVVGNLNTVVQVRLVNFELKEMNGRCEYEYVDIIDGTCTEGQLVKRFCGEVRDASWYTTKGRQLCISHKATAHEPGVLRGFQIATQMVDLNTVACTEGHRDGVRVTDDGVILRSPRLSPSGGYPAYLRCLWHVQAPQGQVISLTFTNFMLHEFCHKSQVEIFDGSDMLPATLLESFCGNQSGHVIYTSHVHLKLRFISESSNTQEGAGFQALVKFKRIDSVACYGQGSHQIEFTEPDAGFSSPNYTGLYPQDSHCRYKISAPPRQSVRVQFLQFKLDHHNPWGQCQRENVTLYDDGFPIATRQIDILCGANLPPPIGSTTRDMYIEFKGFKYPILHSGFKLRFQMIDTAKIGCWKDEQTAGNPAIVDWSPGTLLSPSSWKDHNYCVYNITAPPGQVVKMDVSSFNLQMCGNDCCRLRLYDGAREIFSKCGDETSHYRPPYQGRYVISSTEQMLFRMNGHPQGVQGPPNEYAMAYTFEDKSSLACDVGYQPPLTSWAGTTQTGTINSPNYGRGHFPTHVQCEWRVEAETGQIIDFSVRDVDIPTSDGSRCDGAGLTVMNGLESDVTGVNVMRRVCGTVSYFGRTSTNGLVLKFENSGGRTGRGFTVDYKIRHSTDIACFGEQRLTMDASPGTIVSPPLEPGGYRKCEWQINAPNKKVVNLVFHSINLDILNGKCGSDPTLTFRDGKLPTDPLIYRICSYRKQVSGIPQIASTGPFMNIRFENNFGYFAKFEMSYTFTDPPHRSLSGGQIVGLVLGIVVAILLIAMIFLIVHIKKKRMTRRVVLAARYRAPDTLDRRRQLEVRDRHASASPPLPCSTVLAPDMVHMKPPDYTDLPPPSYEQVVATTQV